MMRVSTALLAWSCYLLLPQLLLLLQCSPSVSVRLATRRRLLSSRESADNHAVVDESVDIAPSWCRSLSPFVKNARRCGCKEGPTPPIKGGACCSMVAYRDGEDCNGNGQCVGFAPGHDERNALKLKANKYIGEFLEIQEYQSPPRPSTSYSLPSIDFEGTGQDAEHHNSFVGTNEFMNDEQLEDRNDASAQARRHGDVFPKAEADTAGVANAGGAGDDDSTEGDDGDDRGGIDAHHVGRDDQKQDDEEDAGKLGGVLDDARARVGAKQSALRSSEPPLRLDTREHVPASASHAPTPAPSRREQAIGVESHDDRRVPLKKGSQFDGLSALSLAAPPPRRSDVRSVPDFAPLTHTLANREARANYLPVHVHVHAHGPPSSNSKVVAAGDRPAAHKRRRLIGADGIVPVHEPTHNILSQASSLLRARGGRRTLTGPPHSSLPRDASLSAESIVSKPRASRTFRMLNLSAVTSPELRRLANHSHASILCARPGSVFFANYSRAVAATRRRLHPDSHAFASEHEEGFHNLRHYGRANCVGVQDTESFADRLFEAIVNWTAPLRKWVLPPPSKAVIRRAPQAATTNGTRRGGGRTSGPDDPSGQDYLASVETAVTSLLQVQAQEHQEPHSSSGLRNRRPMQKGAIDGDSLKERLQMFLQTSASSGDAVRGSYVGYGQTSNFFKQYIVFTEVRSRRAVCFAHDALPPNA